MAALSDNLVWACKEHIFVLCEVAYHSSVCGLSEPLFDREGISFELVIALDFIYQEHQSRINRVFEQPENKPKCHPATFHSDIEGV